MGLASNGLYILIASDQRPHHSVAELKEYRNAPTPVAKWSSGGYAACRGKNLSCSTTHATGCTYKSRGMGPGGDQTVAAIANDESLQVRVRKSHPPRREVNSAPFGTQKVPKRGVSQIREVLRHCKK